jgi:hypothetical protein
MSCRIHSESKLSGVIARKIPLDDDVQTSFAKFERLVASKKRKILDAIRSNQIVCTPAGLRLVGKRTSPAISSDELAS